MQTFLAIFGTLPYAHRGLRLSKIKSIAKISTKAINLWKASGFTASTWGHASCGISMTQLNSLEREALACTGFNKSGKCRIVGLITQFGIMGLPFARIIKETIFQWFDLLKLLSPSDISELKTAWCEARDAIMGSGHSIKKV